VVTAPTAFLAGELEALYGPLPAPVRVIRNGSDVSLHDWPKEPLVLAAGRMWDEAKNLAALEAAAPLVRAPVIIAGDGSALGRLPRERLAALCRRAAVFAAPAWYEPFGLAILEAARAGCSLVLGDISSLRELWEGAARFVHPGDPEALAAAINDALYEPWSAVEHAERYSLQATARAHQDLYRDLVEGALRT
jgi:glycosyltransferase involved in cell wall biosynthesis